MLSKYDSFCVKCHQRIRVGDPIKKDEELGKWVHENCGNGKFVSSRTLSSLLEQADKAEESVPVVKKDFKPSVYQQAVFDFITNGIGNAVIEAVAGSGKTTTIVQALNYTNPNSRVAFLAFNRHIAEELKNRQNMGLIPAHVHVSTIHSLGLSVIKKLEEKPETDRDKVSQIMDNFWPITRKIYKNRYQPDDWAALALALHQSYLSNEMDIDPVTRQENKAKRNIMRKMVGLAKGTLVDCEDQNAVLEMCERYGIEIDQSSYEVVVKLPEVMEACKQNLATIDFDDMIWLPLVHKRLKLNFDKFDFVFVDERQDLNRAQIEFIMNSIQPGTGRVIAVGDRRQSLYGFRGADIRAVDEMTERLNAVQLPLSISYRCPKSVVALAKTIVEQIEPFENAPEGEVLELKYPEFMNQVQLNDMVICRTNAPLVKPAFTMIRKGFKAIIRGQDIGEGLINFVERFNAQDLMQLESLVSEWAEHEHSRLLEQGKELAAEMVIDKYETVMAIANESRTVTELLDKLRMLFSDKREGIVFSSVHRAKGLEANNVYVLHRELMPHPKAKELWEQEQEMNCLYVAITRSKGRLIWVTEEE